MKNVIIVIIVSFISFSAFSQSKPIADETQTETLKTFFKVETYSEFIYQKILKTFQKDCKKVYILFNKKDRNGLYNVYYLYFPLDKQKEIETYLKTI